MQPGVECLLSDFGSLLREFVVVKLYLLPNDTVLDVTKLKAVADDKLNVAKMTVFLFGRVENTVGKGENAGYQYIPVFPVFSKAFI